MLSNISHNNDDFDKKVSAFYKEKLEYELKKMKQQRDLNIEKLKIIKDQHINQVKFNKLNNKEYTLEKQIREYDILIKEKKDEDEVKCMICLDDMKNNITTLICKHKFHFNCLVNLIFHSKNECPLCRTEMADLPDIQEEFSKKNREINVLENEVTFYRNEIIQLSDVILRDSRADEQNNLDLDNYLNEQQREMERRELELNIEIDISRDLELQEIERNRVLNIEQEISRVLDLDLELQENHNDDENYDEYDMD